jgi:hypothetical protein
LKVVSIILAHDVWSGGMGKNLITITIKNTYKIISLINNRYVNREVSRRVGCRLMVGGR